MSQASLSHVRARARRREKVARWIAEHVVRWRAPIPGIPAERGWRVETDEDHPYAAVADTEQQARELAIQSVTRAIATGEYHFDVHAARTAAEEMLAQAEADLVELEVFKDWARGKGEPPETPGDGWPRGLAREYASKRCPNGCRAVFEQDDVSSVPGARDQIARELTRSEDDGERLLAGAWLREAQPVPQAWRGERRWIVGIQNASPDFEETQAADIPMLSEVAFDAVEMQSEAGRRATVLAPRSLTAAQRGLLGAWLDRHREVTSLSCTAKLGRRVRVYGDDHLECTDCKDGWVSIGDRRTDIVTAPARARVARRVLDALEGQPSECMRDGCQDGRVRTKDKCDRCRGTGHNMRGGVPQD